MVDEAGSQPVDPGGELSFLCCVSWRHPARLGSIGPNERPIARARQEFGFDESSEKLVADGTVEPPETLGLGRCQAKAGHLYILALDSLKHVVYTHGPPERNFSIS
jgi:hypothetical protein